MTTTREAALEAALKIYADYNEWTTAGKCNPKSYHFDGIGIAERALSTPATEQQGYVEGLGLKRIVEEVDGAMRHGTWRDAHGMRLKDTPEWVAFYNSLPARPAPQPASEHEYPDPLIAEDRYEDDQPAADTRVVSAFPPHYDGGPIGDGYLKTITAYFKPDEAEHAMAAEVLRLRAIIGTATPAPTYQSRVKPWLDACFGPEIAGDKTERNHRFLEEALELVQSGGCTASEAHQLVDYVYGRPVGEMGQEIGGVMNTLAALCLAYGRDMHEDGETELARVWTKVEKIRAKQAAKPKHSPLPEHTPAPSDKTAEAAQDKTAAELVIDAYDAANPFRQADMHPALCHCNRCAIDWLRALAGKGE